MRVRRRPFGYIHPGSSSLLGKGEIRDAWTWGEEWEESMTSKDVGRGGGDGGGECEQGVRLLQEGGWFTRFGRCGIGLLGRLGLWSP
jgi:hypothetical protein